MKRWVKLAAVAILAAGAVGVASEFARREAQQPTERPRMAAPTPQPATTTIVDATPRPPAPLGYRSYEVETASRAAEICLVFSEPLNPAARYDDFIRLSNNARPAVRVDQGRLCLGGLNFGSQYQVTLRAGLPAQSGATLPADTMTQVALRDRAPLLSLASGLILPREAAGGVPIDTVNIDRLKIKLYRVGDRGLSMLQSYLLDSREMSPWQEREVAESRAALVWDGDLPVNTPRNETGRTLFRLSEVLKERKPGIHLLVVKNAAERTDPESYVPVASQWVLETDLALTTMRGEDGLHVFARSLGNAMPVAGVKLNLIARGNDDLGTVTTDARGQALFPPGLMRGKGGQTPALVTAQKDDDFTFLDLRRAAFDLADRGVEGRTPPGPVDGYLYAERGIFRPGETIQLAGLLRDRAGVAIASVPVTLVLRRPDGVEANRMVVPALRDGGFHQPIVLSASSPRGNWTIQALLDTAAPPIAGLAVEVEDFVPQRLRVDLSAGTTPLPSTAPADLEVRTMFLYGAPGTGISGSGTVKLSAAREPFAAWRGFRFGREDEQLGDLVGEFDVPAADATGLSKVAVSLPQGRNRAQPSMPLEATFTVDMNEPGGRATTQTLTVPVVTRAGYIAVRPVFQRGRVDQGTPAAFDVALVDAEGKAIAATGLRWRVERALHDYSWYQRNGRWSYQRLTSWQVVQSGTLAIEPGQTGAISSQLDWGEYKLIAEGEAGAITTQGFRVGWGASGTADRPDRLEVNADRQVYAAGDTAQVNIRPPAAGKALLVIASDRVHETRELDVPEAGLSVPVKVDAAWGSGAYALLSYYRPVGQPGRTPVRAIGLVHLGVDQKARELSVAIEAPEKMIPRQKLDVAVRVGNASGPVNLTLAAVDEGILQLTRFASPAPERHFLARRALGLELRDDYGRLIEMRREGRQGGDAGGGGKGLDYVPIRTVALFSGLVATDASGLARVTFDVPDFIGQIRLMAVAFDTDRTGHGEGKVIVRDPVLAEPTLPRFLAPGDTARIGVSVHNVEGQAGAYRLQVQANGAVRVTDGEHMLNLAADQRVLPQIGLEAVAEGLATISLELTGPNNYRVVRSWPLQVRPALFPIHESRQITLKPGDTFRVDGANLTNFVAGTTRVGISAAPWSGIDLPGIVSWLNLYPFGCLEQTTSATMPLVMLADSAPLLGLDTPALRQRVQDALNRIVDMQREDGSFGWWGLRGSDADPWIGIFALDLLERARQRGYAIPAAALERGDNWLGRAIAHPHPNVVAYAHYALARRGQTRSGDLRYAADTLRPGALGSAQLAVALAAAGDQARAVRLFDRAMADSHSATLTNVSTQSHADWYRTSLRDAAGILAMAAEAGAIERLPVLMTRMQALDRGLRHTSTQEKGWQVMAAATLARSQGQVRLEANGRTLGGEGVVQYGVPQAELAGGLDVRNPMDRDLALMVSVSGTPLTPPPAASSGGITLNRRILRTDGQVADLGQVKQNDKLVMVLQGCMRRHQGTMALQQLLPAGLEIDAVLQGDDAKRYLNREPNRLPVAEARDDRFVAAVPSRNRWDREEDDMSVAILLRATVQGRFILPAATFEDMYDANRAARTDSAIVVIGQP